MTVIASSAAPNQSHCARSAASFLASWLNFLNFSRLKGSFGIPNFSQRSFLLRLRLRLRSPHLREAGSNGFHRTLEVRGNKYQRLTGLDKFEQPSILLGRPICSAVLHSHQERNSLVFVFGPGRDLANLILSQRARLRIDE